MGGMRMNNTRKMAILGLFVISGVLCAACASLNPNTEGQILAALEAKKSEFKQCYESALEQNRETRGIVGLELKLDGESGSVTSSAVENSTIGDNNMNQCVATSASDISLPEPPGVPVEGHYDINFDFE